MVKHWVQIRCNLARFFAAGFLLAATKLAPARPGTRILVADNGAGIAAQDRSRVFAPFFTTKKDVGTGLGLWVSKELLEKRGGQLWFRSRQGLPSGTVMNIYIPSKGGNVAEPAA